MPYLRGVLGAAALGTVVAFAGIAQAGVVLNDGFDAENAGASQQNYTGFANWDVTGKVDLMKNGEAGVLGAGSFVDLDGTPGPGRLTSKQAYQVDAGALVSLTFDLSGNQRDRNDDYFFAGFDFGAAGLHIEHLTLDGAYGFFDLGSVYALNSETIAPVGGGSPFQTYKISFIADDPGAIRVFLGGLSGDTVGPLLDNVTLTISGVPEPATWSLMIGGFGLVGLALRRRPAPASAA